MSILKKDDQLLEYEQCLTLLRQQLVKENFTGDIDLSHIEPDFFRAINNFRKTATKEHLKTIDALLNQIVKKRLIKLLYHINQPDTRKIHEFLSDEECFFWESVTYAKKKLLEKVMRYDNK